MALELENSALLEYFTALLYILYNLVFPFHVSLCCDNIHFLEMLRSALPTFFIITKVFFSFTLHFNMNAFHLMVVSS